MGLTPGASGQDILNRIADQGKSYSATTQNLEAIFREVAGTIAYAATDAVVTDPIGEKFSIPSDASEITCSEGTRVEYDPDEETITWYIPFVSEANPATLSYIVEIDPDAVSGVVYPTNGDTPIELHQCFRQPGSKALPCAPSRYKRGDHCGPLLQGER